VLRNAVPVAGIGDVVEARMLFGEFIWSHGKPRSCSVRHRGNSVGTLLPATVPAVVVL
jgi:hypothetical protein